MKRTKHRVAQELEAAKAVRDRGGVAKVEELEKELETLNQKPEEPTRNELIARACGDVAGIASHCQNALGQLGSITERVQRALDAKVSSTTQESHLEYIMQDADIARRAINEVWKRAHLVVESGIGIEKKSVEEVSLL